MTISTIGANTVDTFPGVEDTQIKQGSPTSNFSTDTLLQVTKYGVNNHTHTLMKFTGLSNIPSGDVISDVTLYVYNQFNTAPASTTASIRKILASWDNAQVTWNEASTGVNWNTGGGIGAGTDRVDTALGTIPLDQVGTYQSLNSAALLTYIQGIHAGTITNNGFHLERTDAGEDALVSRVQGSLSSDNQRPYLEVTHAAGTSATIISVDTPVLDGQTDIEVYVSNFGSDISSVTLEDLSSTYSATCTIQSGAGDGPYLVTIPDSTSFLVDTLGVPLATTNWPSLNIIVGDGVDTASASFVINPKVGWGIVEMVIPSTAEGSLFYGWAVPPVATDQVRYPTADNFSVTDAGIPSGDQTTGSIGLFLFDTTTGEIKPFDHVLTAIGSPPTGKHSGFMSSFGNLGS